MSTVDKIVAGFPHRDIPNILSVPTYNNIKELNLLLSSNALSVHSNRRNNVLCHLVLIITPDTYFTLAVIVFQPPVNPGPTVVVPPLSTGPVKAVIKRTYKGAPDEWDRFINVNGALKYQFLVSVDPMYIRGIHNIYTAYG